MTSSTKTRREGGRGHVPRTGRPEGRGEVPPAGPRGRVRSGDFRPLRPGNGGRPAVGQHLLHRRRCRRRGSAPTCRRWKTGSIRNPTSKHPLMRDLTGLDEIAFFEAFRFDLSTDRGCRRARRDCWKPARKRRCCSPCRGGRSPIWCMTFPLINDKGKWTTNWNLKLSFPVFLRNVLYKLGNVSDAAAEENDPAGRVKTLRPDVAVNKIEVFAPAAGKPRTVTTQAQGDFATRTRSTSASTGEVGGRRARLRGQPARRDESNIQPRDEIRSATRTLRRARRAAKSARPGNGSRRRLGTAVAGMGHVLPTHFHLIGNAMSSRSRMIAPPNRRPMALTRHGRRATGSSATTAVGPATTTTACRRLDLGDGLAHRPRAVRGPADPARRVRRARLQAHPRRRLRQWPLFAFPAAPGRPRRGADELRPVAGMLPRRRRVSRASASRRPWPTSPACLTPTPAFDAVVCGWVLEHLPDPPRACANWPACCSRAANCCC